MTRVHAASTDAFEGDDRVMIEIKGRSVGVFEYDGEYYAAVNRCPHQGGPVCEGLVRGKLVSDWDGPGERTQEDIDEDQPTLSCPWHGWEYELDTGAHVGDPEFGITTFETTVENGEVFVVVE